MSAARLISIGSINLDLQVRADDVPGFGRLAMARDFTMLGGGKAANVAYLARGLGADVCLIGHVGDDPLAECALRGLRESGVDLSSVRAVRGSATGVAWIVVGPAADKSIVVAANANDVWTDADVEDAMAVVASAPEGSVLIADLEIPEFVVRRVARAAHDRRLRVILDPSPPDRVSLELYSLAECLTPDSAEAAALAGHPVRSVEEAFRAGAKLLERGAPAACVKVGALGCAVVTGDQQAFVPSAKVDAVDTTGAGDAFAAALAVGLVEGRSLVDAARYGNAAAALVVTHYGARPPYPVREGIVRLYASLTTSARSGSQSG